MFDSWRQKSGTNQKLSSMSAQHRKALYREYTQTYTPTVNTVSESLTTAPSAEFVQSFDALKVDSQTDTTYDLNQHLDKIATQLNTLADNINVSVDSASQVLQESSSGRSTVKVSDFNVNDRSKPTSLQTSRTSSSHSLVRTASPHILKLPLTPHGWFS